MNDRLLVERLRLATEAGSVGVWEWTADRTVMNWNDQMYRIYGRSRGDHDCALSLWQQAIVPEDRDTISNALHAARASGTSFAEEFRVSRPDGGVRWVRATARAVLDEGHSEHALLGTTIDITDLKQKQLQDAGQAQARLDAQAAFLSSVSHELRTPLNAVLGLVHLLAPTRLDEEQREYVQEMERASKMLLGLINDILDVAKIEAGEFTLSAEPFNLVDEVDAVYRMLKPMATDKRLDFQFDRGGLEGHRFVGDPQRIRQIVINLLSNAIKFTERGGIVLRLSQVNDAENGRRRLRIEVRDTGVGIPDAEQAGLFKRFRQTASGNAAGSGSSGLGLSIIKDLCRLMNGSVDLQSRPGVGSTFGAEFELTADISDPLSAPADESEATLLHNTRVLLVDDSTMNLKITRKLLEKSGASVMTAVNGSEAVDILRELESPPQVILMDLHMPVMDGITATSVIRQDLKLTDTPIIALTAGAASRDLERAMAAGINQYISKPVEPRHLIDQIASVAVTTPARCASK